MSFAEEFQATDEDVCEQDCGEETEDGDEIARRAELTRQITDVETGGAQETQEDRELPKESNSRENQHQDAVNQTFRNDGTERLGEGHSVHALQRGAAGDLAGAGNDEAGGIGDKDGIDANAAARLFAQRLQCLLPTKRTNHLRNNAKQKRKTHPTPICLMKYAVKKNLTARVAIHPPKNTQTKKEGKTDAKNFLEEGTH